jgi:phosphorylcholine metabolism protein LicD
MNQFNEVVNLLEEMKINYWVDSGTLLGIIRENHLLSHDRDIDFGVIFENEKQINRLIKIFKNEGYFAQIHVYKHQPFKYKFKRKGSKYSIDINHFNEISGYLIAPQRIKLKTMIPFQKVLNFYMKCYFKLFQIYSNSFYHYPKKIFKISSTKKIELNDLEFKIPNQFEKYLEYRYGNWKVKNEKWDFLKSDKALIKIEPDTMKKNLENLIEKVQADKIHKKI